MKRHVAASAAGLALGMALLAGGAAAKDGAPAESRTRGAAAGSRLDLSIREGSLGLTADPLPPGPSLDVEAERAPTGAGSVRWPSSRIEVGRGAYLEVLPACHPGLDDFGRLPRSRGRLPRR
jgi:hypothetical protein